MKIAFVTSHLTLFGGGGKFLMDYANRFNEKGYEITIIALKINQNRYRFNKDISLIEIDDFLPSNPLFWLKFKKIKKKFQKCLEELDFDIVISLNFPSNYFCSDLNKKNKTKHVYYCFEPYRYFHDKKFYSSAPFMLRISSWTLRLFFKKYDIKGALSAEDIICISKFIRNKVKESYGRNAILHYIGIKSYGESNNSFEFKFENNLNLKENTPIIFTLGLSHHMKGAKELIYIFHKILKELPKAILLIGGWIKKENYKIIKKLIRKLRIPENSIIFYGFIEHDNVKNFYEKAKLTFFTALDESFGLIPLESMETGTPVITFKGAGPSETIIDNKNGYLIKNYDLDDFAQKAIKILKNNKIYENFSNNGREHIKNHFNFEISFSKLEKILQEIKPK